MLPLLAQVFLLYCSHLLQASTAQQDILEFRFNSFKTTDILLVNDSAVEADGAIRLTSDTKQFSVGRAFFPTPLRMIAANDGSSNSSRKRITSFSTTFIFSILPSVVANPGFGLAFVLSASTSLPGALPGQYFGLFNNTADRLAAPPIAIEFDTGLNPEFSESDGNHVGIDLNNILSVASKIAGYWDSNSSTSHEIDMRSGKNIQVWIEFDGRKGAINITIALAGMQKPQRPLLSYQNSNFSVFMAEEMYVGFSASIVTWVEAQRILAWSFSSNGTAPQLDTSKLPVFFHETGSSSRPLGLIAGVSYALIVFFIAGTTVGCWLWWKRKNKEEQMEEWEVEYWPHRISNKELHKATNGFASMNLIGSGGFGSVYRGVLPTNNLDVAVKCISNNSKQGLKEFMAEISSMGRLQHKNLVQMRGWCRRGSELMLVYEYMPNGSLDKWIFENPKRDLYAAGQILKAADKRIAGEYEADEMETVLKLGLACCHPEADQRPSVKQVVSVLLG